MKKNRTYGLMEDIGLLKMIKIMRFTIFILFLTLSQAFAIDSYSQQTKLSLDLKNAKVEEVLDKIEKSSEYFFMYNKEMVDVERKIDIQVEEKGINQILDKVFENTGITYSIKDRQILLINNSMLSNGTENVTQQQKTVSGKVADSSGASLPGVSVVVKGTTNGTITDENGNYSISNIPENATLQFSFVGMKGHEVAIGNKSSINVVMEEDAIGIEEVVAIGYGTVKKSDLTGSVSTLQSDAIMLGNSLSPDMALRGKSAGVQITTASGQPGAGAVVRIRGTNSILASNEPLYVVDGVPLDGGESAAGVRGASISPLTIINPSDIESMEVLKDASSTAIYGSRGANGVILITTKKGKRVLTKQTSICLQGFRMYRTD